MSRNASQAVALLAALAALVLAGGPLFAGGVKGTMYNLPDGRNLEKIDAKETIQIRVVRFNTDTAIQLLGEDGKALPLSRGFNDGRVDFTGPTFTFTLPASDTTTDRQAVTLEFFRPERAGDTALLTQVLQAVIVADDKKAVLTIDVSVPLPSQMQAQYPAPYPPCEVWAPVCEPCTARHGLRSRLFHR